MTTSIAGHNTSRSSTPPVPITITPIRPPPGPPEIIRNLEVACIGTLQERIRSAAYNGENLYTSDPKGVINVWNTGSATYVKFLDGFNVPINILHSARKGHDIWIGFANGDMAIMNIANKSIGTRWRAHPGGVSCIVAGTNSVWSGGVDFTVRKWGLDGQTLFSYSYHHSAIRWLLIVKKVPDQAEVQIWSSSDTTIAVSLLSDDAEHHEMVTEVKSLTGHHRAVLVLCEVGFETVWSGSEDCTIKVWSNTDMVCKQTLCGHKGPVCSMVEMGTHVWSGSADQSILVWDAATYQLLYSLGDHGGYLRTMIKVDWQMWVFASGKNVRIWAAASLYGLAKLENDQLRDVIEELRKGKEALEGAAKRKQAQRDAKEQDLKSQLEQLQRNTASKLEEKSAEVLRIKDDCAQRLTYQEMMNKELEEEKDRFAIEVVQLSNRLDNLQLAMESAECQSKSAHALKDERIAILEDEVRTLESRLWREQQDAALAQSDLDTERKVAEDDRATNLLEIAQLKVQVFKEKDSASKAGVESKGYAAQEIAKLREQMKKERDSAVQAAYDDVERLMKQINRDKKSAVKFQEDEEEVGVLKSLLQKEREAAVDVLEHTRRSFENEIKSLKEQTRQEREAAEHSQATIREKIAALDRKLKETQIELQVAQVDLQHTLIKLRDAQEELRMVKEAKNPKVETKDSETKTIAREDFTTLLKTDDDEKGRLREALDGMTKAVESAESASTALAASYNVKVPGTSTAPCNSYMRSSLDQLQFAERIRPSSLYGSGDENSGWTEFLSPALIFFPVVRCILRHCNVKLMRPLPTTTVHHEE